MSDDVVRIYVNTCFVLLLLGAYPIFVLSAADLEAPNNERRWNVKVDENTHIIIRGRVVFPGGMEQSPVVVTYFWRLVKKDEPNNGFLLHVSSHRGNHSPPVPDPITVLEARMIENQILIVFNQAGRSFAHVAQIQEDGTVEVRPGSSDAPPPDKGQDWPYAAGPALKSGSIQLPAEGSPVLVGVDEQDRPVRMELKSWRPRDRDMYYWEATGNAGDSGADG